ncbi:hypothetical protein GCM10027167_32850 [Nocardia heshunensis]
MSGPSARSRPHAASPRFESVELTRLARAGAFCALAGTAASGVASVGAGTGSAAGVPPLAGVVPEPSIGCADAGVARATRRGGGTERGGSGWGTVKSYYIVVTELFDCSYLLADARISA